MFFRVPPQTVFLHIMSDSNTNGTHKIYSQPLPTAVTPGFIFYKKYGIFQMILAIIMIRALI